MKEWLTRERKALRTEYTVLGLIALPLTLPIALTYIVLAGLCCGRDGPRYLGNMMALLFASAVVAYSLIALGIYFLFFR